MLGALIGGGISLIGGLIKNSKANKEKREIQKAIDDYQRQDLVNFAESLTVDTEGADYRKELLDTFTATQIEALRKSGTRGLVGGLPQVAKTATDVGREIQVDLTKQRKDIDTLILEEDVRNKQLQEQREREDLAGLGNALNVASQESSSSLGSIFSGVGNIAFGGLSETVGGGSLFGGGYDSSVPSVTRTFA